MVRAAPQLGYQHSRTRGAHLPFDTGLLTFVQTGHMVDTDAGSRRTKVPKSSVRNWVAQRPSMGVGRKATDWPRKELGNRS